MPFVVKAALDEESAAKLLSFHEKTMYRGKDIRVHDEVFIFSSENQGGHGLCAKGTVTSVDHGHELKPFRDLDDDQPQTEIARKLYRQPTNKIARISDDAAASLDKCF